VAAMHGDQVVAVTGGAVKVLGRFGEIHSIDSSVLTVRDA
jgi:hypothetical protein